MWCGRTRKRERKRHRDRKRVEGEDWREEGKTWEGKREERE